MTKKKKEVKKEDCKHTEARLQMVENKAEETMGLLRDCIDVLKKYKSWLNNVDTQLEKIKSRLGL